jgi:hypothetical protein
LNCEVVSALASKSNDQDRRMNISWETTIVNCLSQFLDKWGTGIGRMGLTHGIRITRRPRNQRNIIRFVGTSLNMYHVLSSKYAGSRGTMFSRGRKNVAVLFREALYRQPLTLRQGCTVVLDATHPASSPTCLNTLPK